MSKQPKYMTLDDVFDTYLSETERPSYEALSRWIARYPQYERELTELTVQWIMMEGLPPAANAVSTDVETLVLRGMSIVQNILYKQEQDSVDREAPGLTGILDEGAKHGLRIQQVADAATMSVTLIRKLDLRLIRFASIPEEAIMFLARAVRSSVESVRRYLQRPPRLARHASYHASQAPTLVDPQDFLDAVRTDPAMKEEQRDYWLAIASSRHR